MFFLDPLLVQDVGGYNFHGVSACSDPFPVLLIPFGAQTKMLSWFTSQELDSFAEKIANDFIERYPLSVVNSEQPAPNRLQQALTELYARASKFKAEHNYGWFKTAKLANAVKWHLKEYGYSDSFVDQVIEGLTIKMAGRDNSLRNK